MLLASMLPVLEPVHCSDMSAKPLCIPVLFDKAVFQTLSRLLSRELCIPVSFGKAVSSLYLCCWIAKRALTSYIDFSVLVVRKMFLVTKAVVTERSHSI